MNPVANPLQDTSQVYSAYILDRRLYINYLSNGLSIQVTWAFWCVMYTVVFLLILFRYASLTCNNSHNAIGSYFFPCFMIFSLASVSSAYTEMLPNVMNRTCMKLNMLVFSLWFSLLKILDFWSFDWLLSPCEEFYACLLNIIFSGWMRTPVCDAGCGVDDPNATNTRI